MSKRDIYAVNIQKDWLISTVPDLDSYLFSLEDLDLTLFISGPDPAPAPPRNSDPPLFHPKLKNVYLKCIEK